MGRQEAWQGGQLQAWPSYMYTSYIHGVTPESLTVQAGSVADSLEGNMADTVRSISSAGMLLSVPRRISEEAGEIGVDM